MLCGIPWEVLPLLNGDRGVVDGGGWAEGRLWKGTGGKEGEKTVGGI